MLDKFIVGRVTRISPEAPVPVVAFDHETHRIGGAANVAHNVAALGGRATLVAVTGHDEAAATLAQACREAGIAPALVGDPTRPTTTKVAHRHRAQSAGGARRLRDRRRDRRRRRAARRRRVQQHAPQRGAIVVSDYLKGCITRG